MDSRGGVRTGGESGSVIVPGKPEDSLMISAIRYDALKMPPNGKLPNEVIADFVTWVRIGAPDPRQGKAIVTPTLNLESTRRLWTYQTPVRPQISAAKDAEWARSDLDRLVWARLETEGLGPAPATNKKTLIRRASYDLLGLPPTSQEIDDFLSDETSEAFANAVDRMLLSVEFGIRWARHWLDNVRYSQDDPTCAANDNGTFNIAPYRDWVVQAFNQDLPYDQFLRMQVAGDLMAPDDPELINADGLTATGVWGLAHLVEGNDKEKVLADFIDEQLDVLGRTFLGLTISCARCHDHKFDPITQEDYYSLAGIFYSSHIFTFRDESARLRNRVQVRVLHTKTEKKEFRGKKRRLRNLEMQIEALEKRHRKALDLVRLQRDLQIQMLKEPETDQERADLKKRVQELRKKESELVTDQKQNGWNVNAAELKRHSELTLERDPLKREVDAVALRMVMREGPVPGTRHQSVGDIAVFHRGDHLSPGKTVPRGFPRVFVFSNAVKNPSPTSSGRLELAHWMTHRDHPLTSRVMANRIWQHLFGTGIVATPSNFGKLGDPPTHPELLDYLAIRLVENNWSVKSLIREIMMSNTYQQACNPSPETIKRDPENRWLGRMNRKRLSAESLKDTLLWHSGLIDRSETEHLPRSGRALYDETSRYKPQAMLTFFDGPDSHLLVPQREDSTSAPQALFMLNNQLVLSAVQTVAKKAIRASQDEATRLSTVYQQLFGRAASMEERQLASWLLRNTRVTRQTLVSNGKQSEVESGAWEDLCLALICSNEFLYVE